MIYSLLILSGPATGHGSRLGVDFAQAVLRAGHSIHRVFFLDEGVSNGMQNAVFPQDEASVTGDWIALAEQHGVELILCVSSALRRGLLDTTEASRYDKLATAHPAFEISGLGQLVDACASSDRVITFGA